MRIERFTVGVVVLIAAASLPGAQTPASFDLLIRGGRVIDGTGSPARIADVGVRRGVIAEVGTLTGATATTILDAGGMAVAPGFIDVHTHADDVAEKPLAENFLRMGVTTIVAGNCGSSTVDVGGAFDKIRRAGVSINFATLVGHNSVREAVMGRAMRAPTPSELASMKGFVEQAMEAGAVGFSTGLQYVPGTYADTSELVDLTTVAATAGGLYATHMRNEGTELEKAVAEAIDVGERAGCPIEISHLKVDSPSRWGLSEKALNMIDAARARGVDVEADQYAYTAASSNLGIRLPSWVLEGGQDEIRKRLDDEATWQRIRTETKALFAERGFTDLSFAVVATYPADASFNGLSIKQIAAKEKGADDVDAQLEVVREMMRAGGASMVYHLMSEEDVARIMRHPFVSVASDSWILPFGAGQPHPRGYGNNARVLGFYVRDRQTMSLEEAVRKMTSLPAAHFKLPGRGRVQPGYAADLVVFDPARVSDPSTYEHPHQYAVGLPDVVVNGVVTIRDGRHTGAKAGQVLTRSRSK